MGFRYSACAAARRLGVTGWVRNLPDGDVEVLAEGESSALADFREWLGEGPPGAWVRSVEVRKVEASGDFDDFGVEY